jgi:hypothetical protein
MNPKTILYKGYRIEKTQGKTNTAIVWKGEDIIKCIAGQILPDGSEVSIKKAKAYIDCLLNPTEQNWSDYSETFCCGM